jgi:mevalonate kinase
MSNRYPALAFSMDTTLPIGAGLGSSSSFAVCLAAALLLQSRTLQVVNLKIVNTWGYLAEQLIHGTPSGIDNAVGTFGGVIAFSGGKIQRQIPQYVVVYTNANTCRIPNLRILIVNTQVKRNTKEIVRRVRENRDKSPIEMDAKFDEIEQIASKCLIDFELTNSGQMSRNELQKQLEELVDRNHKLLNEIGAGHEKLDLVVEIAKKYGYHAKLTGAGGGGCAYILLEDEDKNREDDLKRDLSSEGFQCYASGIGSVGIIVE